MSPRNRTVEVIVCVSYGSDSGSWHVWDIEVPADLDEEAAKKRALEIAEAGIDPELWVVHMGIYAYWDDEMMYDSGIWEDDDEMQAGPE